MEPDLGSSVKKVKQVLCGMALATLLACLLLPLTGCGGLENGPFIAFRRNNQIWTARGDGTGQKRLTNGFDASPAISPDGKTIVYEHSKGNPYKSPETLPGPSVGIFAISSVGGVRRLLTPSSWLTESGWKPLQPLVQGTKWVKRNCTQPSFSPDGKSICFELIDEDYFVPSLGPEGTHTFQGIAIMNADGTGQPRIIFVKDKGETGEHWIGNPRFSQDGNDIYVSYSPAGGYEAGIYEIRVTGGDLTRITPETTYGPPSTPSGYPTFTEYASLGVSPVLNEISVVEESGKGEWIQNRIMRMRLDTQVMREIYAAPHEASLTQPGISSEPLSFTPAGKSVAFADEEYFPYTQHRFTGHIYLVPTEGGKPTRIITNGDQPCCGNRAPNSP